MPHDDADCRVFRLKRNPTNFHRDPASSVCASRPARLTHTPTPAPLAVRDPNVADRAPPSSTSSMVDAAGHAALRHARAAQHPPAHASTTSEHSSAHPRGGMMPRRGGSDAVRAGTEQLSTHTRTAPPCAQDHLTGSGAAVRRDLGLEQHPRPVSHCRASQQHVHLFSAPPPRRPLSSSQVSAAEAASQPPWRHPCAQSAQPAAGDETRVALAAFVRGEACERGPTPKVSTHPSSSATIHPRADDTHARVLAGGSGDDASASGPSGSVNQLYGTGTRLETALFSSASLDGRGTTAMLLRERYSTGATSATVASSTARREATGSSLGTAHSASQASLSRTRYLQTMEGNGRPW